MTKPVLSHFLEQIHEVLVVCCIYQMDLSKLYRQVQYKVQYLVFGNEVPSNGNADFFFSYTFLSVSWSLNVCFPRYFSTPDTYIFLFVSCLLV